MAKAATIAQSTCWDLRVYPLGLLAKDTNGRVGIDNKFFYYRSNPVATYSIWKKIPIEYYKMYVLIMRPSGDLKIITRARYDKLFENEVNEIHGTHR